MTAFAGVGSLTLIVTAEPDFDREWARLDSNVPAKRQIIALKVAPG